jgi:hypothetical protein
MKVGLQFGVWLCGLGLSAAMAVPCAVAQSNNRPPARQQPQPQPSRPPQNNRPAGSYHPQNAPPGRNANRQPSEDRQRSNQDRARSNQNPRNDERNSAQRDAQNQYRRQTPAVPPPNVQDRLRKMSPQDRQRLAQNEQRLRSLPPQQQQELRNRARVWEQMTPGQRDHIRNDVLPKWKQLPSGRQRAIQQRLGVLQNMPESARNRHLNDPMFTRGMNDEDKQMLRDLSHEHIGAPEQPQEQ